MSKTTISVCHTETKILYISFIVLHIHQIIIHLLINFLQIIQRVNLLCQLIQKSLCKCHFQEVSFKNGFTNDLTKEFKHFLPIVKLFAYMVWHEFSITFVFSEKCIFWIKDSVTKFGNKLFEQTTSIYTFLFLSMLIYKLNLKLLFQINFVHVNFVKCIFQDVGSINGDGMESMEFFSLGVYDVLEDFRSEFKWDCVRQIQKE